MRWLVVIFVSLFSAVLITAVCLCFFKSFQLENYLIKKYIKNTIKFNFSIGNKNKLKFTNRLKRLIFVDFLYNFILFFTIFIYFNKIWQIILIFSIFFALSPFVVLGAFVLTKPIENLIKQRYIKRAKDKLSRMKCKKIAITGSYGKTTTKNILYQIMSQEFDICATPKSFNTPMGVCKTILEKLKETDDFFVVEMGARHIGDIDFLAKLVGVDFGIITPIGNCHLETFGGLAQIENAKNELCENTKEAVVFNGKSESSRHLYEKYARKKFLVCQKGSFAYARKIRATPSGTKFEMVIDGCVFECSTKLLGTANVDNIVVAATMAYLLGESLLSIKIGIEKLKPIPHRLELIKGFVNVIDDSYNSNESGFVEALKLLKMFGGQKIVVSPGLVELGKEQEKANFRMGQQVAKVADVFLIMNETNKKVLADGARDGGMDKGRILFAKSRAEQQKILKSILKKGDVVLFENDFPDNLK